MARRRDSRCDDEGYGGGGGRLDDDEAGRVLDANVLACSSSLARTRRSKYPRVCMCSSSSSSTERGNEGDGREGGAESTADVQFPACEESACLKDDASGGERIAALVDRRTSLFGRQILDENEEAITRISAFGVGDVALMIVAAKAGAAARIGISRSSAG